jgi:hypothetical protein
MSDRWIHPDPFDPDHTPPHWVDAAGHFAGWISEQELAEMYDQLADAALQQWEAMQQNPDYAIDLVNLGTAVAGDDDDLIEF